MLLFLHGNDSYLLREAVHNALAHHAEQHPDPRIITVDCTAPDAGDRLEHSLKYPSFFGEHTIVVVHHAGEEVFTDILDRYNLSRIPDVTVFAVQDTTEKTAAATKKMVTRISKQTDRIIETAALTPAARTMWLRNRCATLGIAIEPDALGELATRCASTTWMLANELDKLHAYAHTIPITIAIVRSLVPPLRETEDPWALSNALSTADKRTALTALWKAIGDGAAPELLIGMVGAALRTLAVAADASQNRITPATAAKIAQIHPFVLSKAMRAGAQADAERLTAAHLAVARLDQASKSGQADPIDGLFATLLAL